MISFPGLKGMGMEVAGDTSRTDLKIVLLGGGGVGKSSFIYRYIHQEFSDTKSTIAGAFVLKKWRNFYFSIWDMAGQDKFAKVSSFYCKGAGAAILAYDLTDYYSFSSLEKYLEMLQVSRESAKIVLIGTKLDLVLENPEMRQVSTEEASVWAKKVNASFFETSSRSNINIEEVFDLIGSSIFNCPPELPSPANNCPNSHSSNFPACNRDDKICCSIQ